MVRRGNQTANPRESGLLLRRTAFMVLALGAIRATGALGNAHSVLGFGFAAVGGLGGRYPIRVLVRGCTFTGIRVVGSSRLTIAANRLTARVFGATCLT